MLKSSQNTKELSKDFQDIATKQVDDFFLSQELH